MTESPIYDFIIGGTGASGLMLAYRISLDPWYDDKTILIIDKETKDSNDRTWCFWEKGNGEWDHLLTKQWHHLLFNSSGFNKTIPLGDYSYKMIRSKSLYDHMYFAVKQKSNIVIINSTITSTTEYQDRVEINTSDTIYITKKYITSILDTDLLSSQNAHPYLKQHFEGWFIQTEDHVFNDDMATFMDFDVPQMGNTRFMYTLPLSTNLALVEYTLFSAQLLPQEEYRTEIKNYLKLKGINNYQIIEKEQGNIPMSTYKFDQHNTGRTLYIGSAGGWTKASTGYTFANITKHTLRLVDWMKSNNDFRQFSTRNRYWYYDLVLLDVLNKHNNLGSVIFASIFKKNHISKILLFLDERNTLMGDLKIMLNTKPKWNFTISGIKIMFNLLLQKI